MMLINASTKDCWMSQDIVARLNDFRFSDEVAGRHVWRLFEGDADPEICAPNDAARQPQYVLRHNQRECCGD